jgi:hypothetical protein
MDTGRLVKAVGALVAAMLALVILFWRDWNEPPQVWLYRLSLRGDAVGCYTLLNDRRQIEPRFMDGLAVVRLDSAVGDSPFHPPEFGWRGVQTLDTLGLPSRISPASPAWTADSLTDTIRLSFFRGNAGRVFAFALPAGAPDTLHGRETVVSHTTPHMEERGVAHAVRVACPGPVRSGSGRDTGAGV